MCGIFALLNNTSFSNDIINNEFIKGKERGPESSKLNFLYKNIVFGFHRLAINGLNEISNQPLVIDDVILICNGEIYNYKQLYHDMNIEPKTGSDCEVIIHLYIKYGIEQTLTMLDGVFSFVLYDNRIIKKEKNNIYVARDPFGVRPLYYLKNKLNYSGQNLFGFASELKCLEFFYNSDINNLEIEQFEPGTYTVFTNTYIGAKLEKENVRYFIPVLSNNLLVDEEIIFKNISSYLNSVVTKRCITTERPIACLLSGGLDSSLIAALVNDYYNRNNMPNKLETYSIGLEGSEDLKYAKIVADYLGTNHTEIIVTEQIMFEAIPDVIYAIESYDTTSVRASIGNFLLGKYISSHSEAKVIFNGDGSDELFGGYLYMNKCPDDIEFDKETRRLLKDIHMFDVLRSDKCISSWGLEPRTPFLDRSFVNYILSIPPYYRNHKNKNNCEKFILRNSFFQKYFVDSNGRQILPDEILFRKKEAFSDGVSTHGRSLYQILQEKITEKMSNENNFQEIENITNIEKEKFYYKQLFLNNFPNCQMLLPYYWMPKYIESNDPSARTLSIYK